MLKLNFRSNSCNFVDYISFWWTKQLVQGLQKTLEDLCPPSLTDKLLVSPVCLRVLWYDQPFLHCLPWLPRLVTQWFVSVAATWFPNCWHQSHCVKQFLHVKNKEVCCEALQSVWLFLSLSDLRPSPSGPELRGDVHVCVQSARRQPGSRSGT